MGITKTIGGDRVGSGRKMKAHLNNYYRSTHNLSEKFASSMGSGILYPALCKLAMRGDNFDITIDADARTIPTQGPLFGSYKMQVDVYQCPVRLYQALLHNNPTAIGLNMAKIKFPTIVLNVESDKPEHFKINNSALLKYLGMSGLGLPQVANGGGLIPNQIYDCQRSINAMPALAYYDIFKNYYANKQEEKGYVITCEQLEAKNPIFRVRVFRNGENVQDYNPYEKQRIELNGVYRIDIEFNNSNNYSIQQIVRGIYNQINDTPLSEYAASESEDQGSNNIVYLSYKFEEATDTIIIDTDLLTSDFYTPPIIKEFNLSNIDDMRYEILSHHQFGESLKLHSTNAGSDYPYNTLYECITTDQEIPLPGGGTQDITRMIPKNCFAENGLVLKTYQNDIFNNWLNSDWIEGENGIGELSKVSVTNGEFSIDALSFATKLYNMLNRVVLSGNTYEDWQDVVYEEVKRRQVESPIYCGGMSQEIYFDEIVQTAPADGDPLGTLGGRGRLGSKKKGGKLHIKCDEACFIIAIVSLTPRIFYTQGNEFYMTDVMSMDDIHKPPMDNIGFQDLIGERLAWFDTILGTREGGNIQEVLHRSKIGKVPAWIEYMTSVDKAYGDFADTDGKGYMILNRNYEHAETEDGKLDNGIKDATTYVDPAKYNYAFAYTELEAQNFWVEINFGIKARRLMSARLIPHV